MRQDLSEEELDKLKIAWLNMKMHGSTKYSPEIVQEVMEGEETPIITKNRRGDKGRMSLRTRSQFSKEFAQPLFPYPEGNASYVQSA